MSVEMSMEQSFSPTTMKAEKQNTDIVAVSLPVLGQALKDAVTDAPHMRCLVKKIGRLKKQIFKLLKVLKYSAEKSELRLPMGQDLVLITAIV